MSDLQGSTRPRLTSLLPSAVLSSIFLKEKLTFFGKVRDVSTETLLCV